MIFSLPPIINSSLTGGRVFYTAVALLYNLGNSKPGVKVMVKPIFCKVYIEEKSYEMFWKIYIVWGGVPGVI